MVEARQCDGAQQAQYPSITGDWAVFGAALKRLLDGGLSVDMELGPQGYYIELRDGPTQAAVAHDAELRVALARAVEAMPKGALE